ncbi:GLPGLI family protein [Filimonas lacunae]|uniref:GLPGLI family protein n=2 Tax=Filimonas lacunae TaxID=477680 RepID=A0A1N7PX44_9BACT|nr:GLPGLI family protein [Filimonas lacunae]
MLILMASGAVAQAPKVVADCTITFNVNIANSDGTAEHATKTLYLKGSETRSDLVSPTFQQTTFYDGKKEEAVILRELGGNKYMSRLNAAQWKEQNKRYEGMQVTLGNETKTILGYECKKAEVKLKDGSVLNMFYAVAITPSVSENTYQFKGIPGFVLEYESQTEKGNKISFSATVINLSPVPASKFQIPTTGYRIL